MAVPERYSNWTTTFPFAINNVGIPTNTALTQNFSVPRTETVPVLAEFQPQGEEPSGWRHRTEHPTFVRVLSSGVGSASLNFESFDLQATDISAGSGVSQTKVLLFRVSEFTSPGATRVHNMKIWASDTSDFLEPQTHKLLYTTKTPWSSGFKFTAADIGNTSYWMPTSLPDSQNLFRTGRTQASDDLGGGFRTILGSGDADVSQWVYIALSASGTMPLAEYGSTKNGPEGFNIRVSYSCDNLAEKFGD